MKKILSFVLVLAMIASMMCVSVSAAELTDCNDHDGVTHLVGEHDHKKNAEDGADTANGTSGDMLIKAYINGEKVTKYAVDLVFTQKTIYIESDLEWDVNKLHYEGTAKIAVLTAGTTKPAENSQDWVALVDYDAQNAASVVQKVATFAVTNYSCAAITVKANVSTDTSGDGKITTVVHETGETRGDVDSTGTFEAVISENAGTVKSVDGYNNTTSGTAYTMSYEADMYCSDWATALYNMTDTPEATHFTIASITFTIAPAN